MNIALPQKIQSDAVDFRPGGSVTIKKDFLEPALSMTAPVIRKGKFRFQMNVTTNAAGEAIADGGMLTHIFNRLIIKDRSGERFNLSGGEVRMVAQQELGWGYIDPDPIVGTQTIDVEFYLPVLFTLADKSISPDDTSLVLPDFYTGGEITINFVNGEIGNGIDDTSTITVNSGTVSFIAEVIDEGVQEAKARLALFSTSLVNNDSSYPLNGKLRMAMLYVGDLNEEVGSGWGFSGNTYESRSLNYLQLPQTGAKEDYLEEGYQDPSSSMVANEFALPFYVTHRGSKIVRQPVFNNLHVKFSQAVPVGATLVTQQYTPRSATSVALAFRGVAPSALADAISSGGVVPGNSGSVPIAALPSDQTRYMPVRLQAPAASSPTTPVGQPVR